MVRRRPKPVVLAMRPVPSAYSDHHARCPRCDSAGEVVGVIALRLVYRCASCGVKFYAGR